MLWKGLQDVTICYNTYNVVNIPKNRYLLVDNPHEDPNQLGALSSMPNCFGKSRNLSFLFKFLTINSLFFLFACFNFYLHLNNSFHFYMLLQVCTDKQKRYSLAVHGVLQFKCMLRQPYDKTRAILG